MANNLDVGEEELITLHATFFQPQQHTEQLDDGTNSSNRDFLRALIEEVRQYRCLWDSSCRATIANICSYFVGLMRKYAKNRA